VNQTSWKPTKKWWLALVGSVSTLAAHFIATDFTFGDTEQGMVVTAIAALAAAYIKRNDATSTADGVPQA
jgi:hypothetical protein